MLLARRERESFFQGSFSWTCFTGRLRCVQRLLYLYVKPFWDQELEFLPERNSGTLNFERIQDGHSLADAIGLLVLALQMSQRNSKCC